jgi:hypothetical protein
MDRLGHARPTRRFRRGGTAAAALFAATPLRAGDDDKAPAYKIYIDPETGKYTTRDPDAAEASQLTAQPAAKAESGDTTELPLLLTAAAMIVAVAVFVLVSRQRKLNDSRHP